MNTKKLLMLTPATTDHTLLYLVNQVRDSFCDSFEGRVVSLRPTLRACADGNLNVSQLSGLHVPSFSGWTVDSVEPSN